MKHSPKRPKLVLSFFFVCLFSLPVCHRLKAGDFGKDAGASTEAAGTMICQNLKKLELPGNDDYSLADAPLRFARSSDTPETGAQQDATSTSSRRTILRSWRSPPSNMNDQGTRVAQMSGASSPMLLELKAPDAPIRTPRGRRLTAAQGQGLPFGDILASERCYYDTVIGEDKRFYFKGNIDYDTFYHQGRKYHRAFFTMIFPEKKVVDDFIMTNDGTYFIPVFSMRTVEDQYGKLVRTEEIAFYPERSKARIVREILDPEFTEEHESSKNMDFEIDIVPGTYAAMMFDFGYRVADLKVGDEAALHMLSRQGMFCRMKIKVDEIVEIQTQMKNYFCYKIVQRPDNMYMKHMKFFLNIPGLVKKMILPKITFYYSVDQPHRLVDYYGYKDFGPASLKIQQAGLLFEDYMDVRLTRHETLGPNDVPHSDFLFARLEKYQLLKPASASLSPPPPTSTNRAPKDAKKIGFPAGKAIWPERVHYEARGERDKRLLYRGYTDYTTFQHQGKVFHRALNAMMLPEQRIVEDAVMRHEDGIYKPVFFMRSVEDSRGVLARLEEIAFNTGEGNARIVRNLLNPQFREEGESTKNMDLTLAIPGDTYGPLMVDMAYRNLDMNVGDASTMHFLNRKGMLAKVKIKADKLVEVDTPAGNFLCMKIEQVPSNINMKHLRFFLGLPDFLENTVMPKTDFYYSTEAPHRFVLFSAPPGSGPGTLRLQQSGLLSEGEVEVKITRIEKPGLDNLARNDFMFTRLANYNLAGFSPTGATYPSPEAVGESPSPAGATPRRPARSAIGGKLPDIPLLPGDSPSAMTPPLSGLKTAGTDPLMELKRPPGGSIHGSGLSSAPLAPPTSEEEEIDRRLQDIYQKFYTGK